MTRRRQSEDENNRNLGREFKSHPQLLGAAFAYSSGDPEKLGDALIAFTTPDTQDVISELPTLLARPDIQKSLSSLYHSEHGTTGRQRLTPKGEQKPAPQLEQTVRNVFPDDNDELVNFKTSVLTLAYAVCFTSHPQKLAVATQLLKKFGMWQKEIVDTIDDLRFE